MMKKSFAPVLVLVVLCVIINDVKSQRSVEKVNPVEESALGIIGGHNITIEEAPYQVYLEITVNKCQIFSCGGTIISEKYILTAAHCLTNAKIVSVFLGSANKWKMEKVYTSTIFYSHPLYDSCTNNFDVGIIMIDEGIELNGNTTKIIELIDEGTDLKNGSKILATGWGMTSVKEGSDSDYLLGVEMPIVSQDECKRIDPRMISGFCAGEPEGGKSTCQGDSGGPAVLVESGKQAGIISYSFKECASKGIPEFFANVANPEIRNFIKIFANV